jgi:hypothetical protein|tara:strand:- start:160 stop:321 length:162 start_codon:yes stop_codon:yes gene_type:complete
MDEEANELFFKLQKLSQIEDSGVEVFIDEDGEVEFEIDYDVFMSMLRDEDKNK